MVGNRDPAGYKKAQTRQGLGNVPPIRIEDVAGQNLGADGEDLGVHAGTLISVLREPLCFPRELWFLQGFACCPQRLPWPPRYRPPDSPRSRVGSSRAHPA